MLPLPSQTIPPDLLLKALGITGLAPATVPPKVPGAALGQIPVDIQQKLASTLASSTLEGPPAKVARLGEDNLDGSLVSLASQLSQTAPLPPQLSQLAPQLASLQPLLAAPTQLPHLTAPPPPTQAQPSEGLGASPDPSQATSADSSGYRYQPSTTCNECGKDSEIGALDPGNRLWYCRACWLKITPEGVEGPFADENDEAACPKKDVNCDVDSDTVAAPSANDSAKKTHWAQVFATLQQVGQSHQALEYAQRLRKLRGTIQDLFAKYKEALASEDELLQTAYREALDSYKKQQEAQEQAAAQTAQMGSQNALLLDAAYKEAIDLQVQAHQEVEAHAAELQRAVQGAHQNAAVALAQAETKSGRPPGKLPRRPGQQPCKFYMRTGDCAYGVTCKWDHPERPKAPPPTVVTGLVGLPVPVPGITQ